MSNATRSSIANALYEMSKTYNGKELSNRTASYLSVERRSKDLSSVLRTLEQLRYTRDGIIEAHVESAFELSDVSRAKIVDMIASEHKDKAVTILLQEKIVTDLLTGVRVTALGKEFDSTALQKITMLKTLAVTA